MLQFFQSRSIHQGQHKELLPSEGHGPGAWANAASRVESSVCLLFCTPLLKSPAMRWTPSWVQRHCSKSSKLMHLNHCSAHLLLMWILRSTKNAAIKHQPFESPNHDQALERPLRITLCWYEDVVRRNFTIKKCPCSRRLQKLFAASTWTLRQGSVRLVSSATSWWKMKSQEPHTRQATFLDHHGRVVRSKDISG